MNWVHMSVLGFIRNCCLVVVLALVFAACSDEDHPDALKSDTSEVNDVCTGKPAEGCACTEQGEECCLGYGEGLACSFNDTPWLYPAQSVLVWKHFWDCPCMEDWDCTGPFPAMCWQLQGER